MDIHFANPNDPPGDTNTSKQADQSRMILMCRGQKGAGAATLHREKRRPLDVTLGRWGRDRGWLLEIVWPGQLCLSSSLVPGRKHHVLGQMVWDSFLQSSQFSRKRWRFHHQENMNQWEDRIMSNSWIKSRLCYDVIEIWGSKVMSFG